jgi:hypothetical protein
MADCIQFSRATGIPPDSMRTTGAGGVGVRKMVMRTGRIDHRTRARSAPRAIRVPEKCGGTPDIMARGAKRVAIGRLLGVEEHDSLKRRIWSVEGDEPGAAGWSRAFHGERGRLLRSGVPGQGRAPHALESYNRSDHEVSGDQARMSLAIGGACSRQDFAVPPASWPAGIVRRGNLNI